MEQKPGPRTKWTFLTNHARVLVQIARDPGVRVRDIAARCLLTERAVQRIIADLEEGGYLTHTRIGRTNRYQVTAASPLRHPADAGPTVADLLNLLANHQSANRHPDGHQPVGHQPGPTTASVARASVDIAEGAA